jgi:hypothetical protein
MSNIIPAPEPTYSEYRLKDIPKDMIGKTIDITLSIKASVSLYVVDIYFANKNK